MLYTDIKYVNILYIIIKCIIQIYLQWYFLMSPWQHVGRIWQNVSLIVVRTIFFEYHLV